MPVTIPDGPFILVDGSSYLFRAFHALPPLTNASGLPTGAIYGVINMLEKLVDTYPPAHIAVVFDCKGPTFRHELFAPYKANRTAMPEELSVQIEPLHSLIQALGYPLLKVPGVEADDVIATLTRQAEQQGLFTLISSGDKDLAQLVSDKVALINTMSDQILDPAGVIEKFGVPPARIIDYLSLVGDTSDNIPGVPKVGPKTAVKWLDSYDTLANLMANAEEIKGKVGENLRQALADLPLYQTLVTLKADVALDQTPAELTRQAMDVPALKHWYQALEFKTWYKRLAETESEASKPVSAYQTILTWPAWQALLTQLEQATHFALDTETTSLNPLDAELVGISLSLAAGQAAYVPLGHIYEDVPPQLDRAKVLQSLAPLLNDTAKCLIAHNWKYDRAILANYDMHPQCQIFDTLLASYVINSTASKHDMDTLAATHLNHQTTPYEAVAGKGAKQICFSAVAIPEAAAYAAEDAEITLRLFHHFSPQLAATPALQQLYQQIEMPLIEVLYQMEHHGVLLDTQSLAMQSQALAERLTELEQAAHSLAGHPFNLNSPKQIQAILYDELKLPVLKKTPTGQASTSEPILQELALDYPLPKLILEYRSLNKLKTTYTDKLPLAIHPKTGRVHTHYHQAVTATGRLSSSEPNLQNIPIRTHEGRKIRQAFIAPPGHKLISADYSQIELRIMAHLSEDENLVATFQRGEDVHRATASEIFNQPQAEVTQDMRRHAKAINFGLMYGMSAFGLSQQLNIDRKEAEHYMTAYFEKFPGVAAFMEATRTKAAQQGYVETLMGRRLYLPDINARNVQKKRAAERAAINAPMQGAQADIIKLAMIQIQAHISAHAPFMKMLMQVHDELIFEIPEPEVDSQVKIIQHIMTSVVKLKVALLVEMGIGDNWDQAH